LSTIFERLARGGHGMQPGDYEDWKRTVGATPEEAFARAATEVFQRLGPDAYHAYLHSDAGGASPFDGLGLTQASEVATTLVEALAARQIGSAQGAAAGVDMANPHEMTISDLTRLANWTSRNRPDALGETAARFRGRPDILASLLGRDGILALETVLGGVPPAISLPTSALEPSSQLDARQVEPTLVTEAGVEESPLPDFGDPDRVTELPSWAQVQPAYRATWEQRHAAEGRVWDDVAPAYQFAYAAQRSPSYRGQSFATAESSLRRDWDLHGTSMPWDGVRAYVQEVWQGQVR
jgi:hypothetical protein